MASTASDLIKFEKQTTGENASTWGTKANTAMSRIEEAIAGMTTITVAGSTYVLDDTQYQENATTTAESHLAIIKCNGTPGASRQITVPLRTKTYLFWNNVTTYDLTVAGATGDSVTVPNGYLMWVFCDGTNVEAASAAFTVAGVLAAAALPAATTSAIGGVEQSTSAENTEGTADDKFPSVLGVREIASLIPQNSQSTAYTAVSTDAGKHLLHPSGSGSDTFTIPSNASVAFVVGTALSFVNRSTGNLSIAITSDTMRLAVDGTTGTRTLEENGVATALKIGSTEWIISGSGLT